MIVSNERTFLIDSTCTLNLQRRITTVNGLQSPLITQMGVYCDHFKLVLNGTRDKPTGNHGMFVLDKTACHAAELNREMHPL